MPNKKELQSLADKQLRTYGISSPEAATYDIEILTAEQTAALGPEFEARPSLLFQYRHTNASLIPKKEFFRIRYLTDAPQGGWGASVKQQRYSQPRGSLNSIYLPNMGENGAPIVWSDVAKNATTSLLITEGEGKAICACKHGLLTIALGGVSMFKSAPRGLTLLPELEKFDWKGRSVSIVFDTDLPTGYKPEVLKAANSLADSLLLRGAIVKVALLPPSLNGTKVALDDFILREGIARLLMEIIPSASLAHSDFKQMAALSNGYGYLSHIDRFVDKHSRGSDSFLLPDHFNRIHHDIHVSLPTRSTLRMGNDYIVKDVPRIVRPVEACLRWPGFPRYRGMLYRPGQPSAIEWEGDVYLNLWKGWWCDYTANPSKLPSPERMAHILGEWFWAIENVFGEDPEMHAFATHWLHYPLKYPGAKLDTLLLVYSLQQGIGKSFIGHMLGKYVYGATPPGIAHAWVMKHGEMDRQFNRYKMATSLIVMDDVSLSAKREFYEKLKSDVTESSSMINIKGVSEFMAEVCNNYYLSSNDQRPLIIDAYDRRAAVHCIRNAKPDTDRYVALDKLFRTGEAGATILHWAREKYAEGSFDCHTRAPMTDSKNELVSSGKSELNAWLHDLMEHPEYLVRSICTSEELLALYMLEHSLDSEHSKATTTIVGLILSGYGVRRFSRGEQVYYEGKRNRFWMLDKEENWEDMPRESLMEVLHKPFVRSEKVVPFRRGKHAHK